MGIFASIPPEVRQEVRSRHRAAVQRDRAKKRRKNAMRERDITIPAIDNEWLDAVFRDDQADKKKAAVSGRSVNGETRS